MLVMMHNTEDTSFGTWCDPLSMRSTSTGAEKELREPLTAFRCFTLRSRPAAAFFAARLASCSAPFAPAALQHSDPPHSRAATIPLMSDWTH